MLHNLFEITAMLHKEKIALSFENQVMSYEQLNIKANQLAHELIKNGVICGDNIAILLDRSLEMVISILAVLKAGGAYVPIDPGYPDSAIDYIINDCSPKIILTNSKIKSQKNYYNIKKVYVDKSAELNPNNPNINIPDDALAYIIYTSGSTGRPKGVMIEHRNVISLLDAIEINYTSSDIWTLFHSISFDFSVWELFGALLSGAKLIIVPNNIRQNFREYRRLLIDNKVTILNQTPSAFYSLQMEELIYNENKLSLTHIIFGGEKLNPVYLREWKNKYPEIKLINMYGITETTIHVTYKELKEEDIISNTSDIGKALHHLKIYLLDEKCNPVLNGEVGEIFVEGYGLARGYINNPNLTKEKFIECPNISKNKVYRSGDLGRYLPNGNIEYIGRADNQVKIRGHRIELEEIESHLNKYAEIKQSIVIAFETNETDRILKAFYTSDANINSDKMLNYLASKLPHYMLPVTFTRIEKFFLTPNGKIDRKRMYDCIEIKSDDFTSHSADCDNLSCLQKRILEVITSNLNEKLLNNISLGEGFESIGFDSITFIKMIITLEEEFNFMFDNQMLLNAKKSSIKTIVEYVESKLIAN